MYVCAGGREGGGRVGMRERERGRHTDTYNHLLNPIRHVTDEERDEDLDQEEPMLHANHEPQHSNASLKVQATIRQNVQAAPVLLESSVLARGRKIRKHVTH